MDDQAPYIADVGKVREQLHAGDELYARLIAALEAEGEDRAGALGANLPRQRMIGVRRQAGVVDPRDLRALGEVAGDGERVLAVLGHAQRQSLDAGEDQEGVERRDGRSYV